MDSEISAVSGRYILHNLLGQGGMGIVYRAKDRLTGQMVALKQVTTPASNLQFGSESKTSDIEGLRLSLANEFQILASLRHPNIISVLDYGFDELGLPYFTMEYLDKAQSIIEAAADNHPTVVEKMGLLIQVLHALSYLHRRSILHRDLKPGNILVVDDIVRVLDFGLSIAVNQATGTVGTFAYISPEVLVGKPASEQSDLYAVGVMAYEMLAEQHPFPMKDTNKRLLAILEEMPDMSLIKVSKELERVITRLLQKKPESRYESAEACLVDLYRALDQPHPEESIAIRESFLQAAKFVGRESEMSRLAIALSESLNNQGSTWLIGGESGVGKSRLLDELRTLALVNGFLVLRGQGVRGGGVTYQLWREPLRRIVLSTELNDLEAGVLKQIIPDIETLLNRPIPDAPPIEGQAGQQRLFSTIAMLFYRQDNPVLLMLEDLQWAVESIDVLKQLDRLVGERPLLIVSTYRDDEHPHLPHHLPSAQALKLERLSDADIAELSTSMLGEKGQTPEVMALLQRETEGNAFFLVEVVRALAEEAGRLTNIHAMTLPEQIFPQGIQTIVQRRLDRVPVKAQPLLQLAAVAGRQLDLKIVGNLNGVSNIDQWLTTCVNAAVLEIRDERWQFAHDKLREGLLNTLEEQERIALHRHVAEVIEQTYPNDPEQAATLMQHWQVVGDRLKERHYAFVAGELAADQYANTEAIHYLSRALELTSPEETEQHYQLLLARERVYDLQGARQEQALDLQSLDELAAQLNDPQAQIEVALRRANYAAAVGDYPAASTAAQQAASLAEEAGDTAKEAEGYLWWGRALWRQAQYDEARQQLEQALNLAQVHRQAAEQSGIGDVEAQALRNLGIIAGLQSDYETARMHFEQSLYLFREIDDPRGESGALNNLGVIAKGQGDYGAAQSYYEQSLQRCREIGDRWGESLALSNLGGIALNYGAYESAKDYYEQAARVCRQIGNSYVEVFALSSLGLLFHQIGDHEIARSYSQQVLEIAQDLGAPGERGFALTILGHALVGLQQYDEAIAAYTEALQLRRELRQPNLATEPLAGLARAYLSKDDFRQALTFVEEILTHLETNTLAGTDEPYRIYLTCYHVLRVNLDPRAKEILKKAYEQLEEQAAKIVDDQMRQSFLDNVISHRRLRLAYQTSSSTQN